MLVHWNALFTDNKTALSSNLLQPDVIMITRTYEKKAKGGTNRRKMSYGGCKMSPYPTSWCSFNFLVLWDLMGCMLLQLKIVMCPYL